MTHLTLSLLISLILCSGDSTVPRRSKIYWIDNLHMMIRRANLDGTEAEALFKPPRDEFLPPSSLALDSRRHRLYWTEQLLPPARSMGVRPKTRIRRANLDGSSIETVVEGLNDVRAIALDEVRGRLFWTGYDLTTRTATIGHCDLDGGDIHQTLLPGLAAQPSALAVDSVEERLYWLPLHEPWILPLSTDGAWRGWPITYRGRHELEGLAIDPVSRTILWSEDNNPKIVQARLDGTIERQFTVQGLGHDDRLWDDRLIRDLALDSQRDMVYWSDTRGIFRAKMDGTQITKIADVSDSWPPPSIALFLPYRGERQSVVEEQSVWSKTGIRLIPAIGALWLCTTSALLVVLWRRRRRRREERNRKWVRWIARAGFLGCAVVVSVWIVTIDGAWSGTQRRIDYGSPDGTIRLGIQRGVLFLRRWRGFVTPFPRGWGSHPLSPPPSVEPFLQRIGFTLPTYQRYGPSRTGSSSITVTIPLWLLCAVAALPVPVALLLRRRKRPGLCQGCHYDLTGNTSGMCPECGTQIPEPREQQAE